MLLVSSDDVLLSVRMPWIVESSSSSTSVTAVSTPCAFAPGSTVETEMIGGSMSGSSRTESRVYPINPKSTSAADNMLASTGRRMAVSESFMVENFPGSVIRPDSPQRNGRSVALVPNSRRRYVEKEIGKSTSSVPVVSELKGPERMPKCAGPQDAQSHTRRFCTHGRTTRLQRGRAGRTAKAPVLKTGGRKPLQVRILCPPLR